MKKLDKNSLELAVIFKKRINSKGIMIFQPVDIIIGQLDEESNLFVTRSNDQYYYIIGNNEYLYGFGIRRNLSELKEKYNIKFQNVHELKEFIFKYLKELKEYKFYCTMINGDNNSFDLVMEHKRNHDKFSVLDRDFDKFKKRFINSQKLDFDVKCLSDGIKSEVIGQDEAIDDIVTIIWQNLRSENSKSNILLIGPTGVGKTEIIRNITKRLNIPMIMVNATDLTPTSYRGSSVSDYIKGLLKSADYDVSKASRGIIFIDEIDKKSNTSNDSNAEVYTTGVQDELLKLLEDGEYQVNISDNELHPKYVTLSTKNITFICSGAFSLMNEKRVEKVGKTIGFNSKSVPDVSSQSKVITPNDLVTYGLKPELVGRFSNIIKLNPLNKDNLISIMKNPNNKTIQEKINILNDLGIKFTIEEEVYGLLAEKALKNDTGARGLVSTVDSLFIKAMQEVSKNQNAYEELIISKETIDNPKKYTLIRKKEGKGI